MSFLRLLDNSGYIKVNFISDDAIAHDMNERNRVNNYPAVASPALMGGYVYPILDDIVSEYGNKATYQILKAPLPKDDHIRRDYLLKLCNQYETMFAYVDGGAVTIVQIDDWNRVARSLHSLGWQVNAGPKTFKRLKTLSRPFRLWSITDRPLRVAIVDDDDYCDEDLSEYSDEDKVRLLDGAIVIHPRLFDECLNNLAFPEFVHDDDHPEFAVDYYRAQEYLRQAQSFEAFNARIFGPMHFIGLSHEDELVENPGMLKGEAFKDASNTCEQLKVDIICARSAVKFEVSNRRQTIVLLEPQKAKLTGISSDLQTMINLPAMYQPQDTANWTRNFLLANFERLRKNEVMESWFDLSSPFFNASSRVFNMNDVLTLTKWNARAWLMSGMRITDSPWLFEQLGSAIAKTLRSDDQSRLRFPVPCAIRCQVISASFASMSGVDFPVQRESARWCPDLQAVVVNDIDWLEMYRSHGGHDLDDFFVVYYRTIGNVRKLVVVRSPNDWGEYSIFDYVEGDWYPQMETHDGNFILFPQVSDDPALWPQRLSEAFEEGKILYTGLPSETEEVDFEPHPYGFEDVKFLIENNRSSASCVGANVNARGLWSLTMKQHRQVQLATMEACIDTGTQGGSQADIQAVHAEARSIVDDVITDQSVRISAYMWFSRFAPIFRQPFDRSRLTNDTHIDKAHQFRLDAAKSFMRMVREYAQTHFTKNLNPLIHKLGLKHLRPAYNVIVATRTNMYRMQNQGEQSLEPGTWRDVHSLILDEINKFETEVDKFDFVLGLYSASFKAKTTSSGRITDQLVMNPHIFPYLLNALRFYGIAYYVDVDEHGNLIRYRKNEWNLVCNQCGTVRTTEDPLVLQSFHTFDGICKDCRAKVVVTLNS